jgi:hypothetical protein
MQSPLSLVTDPWFSQGTPVSSTNKTDRHDITEILLKVALNTITQPLVTSSELLFLVKHNRICHQRQPKSHSL